MTIRAKYEAFAPIWRVMRGDAMSIDEVERQVSGMTGVMKSASAASDIRNHTFSGEVVNAQASRPVGRGLYFSCRSFAGPLARHPSPCALHSTTHTLSTLIPQNFMWLRTAGGVLPSAGGQRAGLHDRRAERARRARRGVVRLLRRPGGACACGVSFVGAGALLGSFE